GDGGPAGGHHAVAKAFGSPLAVHNDAEGGESFEGEVAVEATGGKVEALGGIVGGSDKRVHAFFSSQVDLILKRFSTVTRQVSRPSMDYLHFQAAPCERASLLD